MIKCCWYLSNSCSCYYEQCYYQIVCVCFNDFYIFYIIVCTNSKIMRFDKLSPSPGTVRAQVLQRAVTYCPHAEILWLMVRAPSGDGQVSTGCWSWIKTGSPWPACWVVAIGFASSLYIVIFNYIHVYLRIFNSIMTSLLLLVKSEISNYLVRLQVLDLTELVSPSRVLWFPGHQVTKSMTIAGDASWSYATVTNLHPCVTREFAPYILDITIIPFVSCTYWVCQVLVNHEALPVGKSIES